MKAEHIRADVVTCCSLISALESGGQWHLSLQLFVQMCLGLKPNNTYGPLYKVGLELQQAGFDSPELNLLTAACCRNMTSDLDEAA